MTQYQPATHSLSPRRQFARGIHDMQVAALVNGLRQLIEPFTVYERPGGEIIVADGKFYRQAAFWIRSDNDDCLFDFTVCCESAVIPPAKVRDALDEIEELRAQLGRLLRVGAISLDDVKWSRKKARIAAVEHHRCGKFQVKKLLPHPLADWMTNRNAGYGMAVRMGAGA